MRPRSRKGATYADIEALPEGVIGELFGDELIVSPRPGPLHEMAATKLVVQLNELEDGAAQGPGGRWRILFEPELRLGGDVMIPDAAAWRWDRMPTLPKAGFFDVAPDWVCEVVSPDSGRLDRIYKLPRYAKANVGHAWVIDPAARTFDAFRLQAGLWLLLGSHGGDERARIEPFQDLELALPRLWPDDLPNVQSDGPTYD